jgi:polyadenylate-binding protein
MASLPTKVQPSASLYVGDLLPTVTEANLFEIFTNVGHIASIRVCRDHLTKRSLGYAYVNYLQVADAERALDTLNNTLIKGRPCRIMWCQRDPSVRKSGVGNIFIKNLDPATGHKELYDIFSSYGNILSCKVAFDENGQNKGFGFVHFESQDSANRAIHENNNKMVGNKVIYVGRFESKKERNQQKESTWTNVYIKNIGLDVSDKELRDAFGRYGKITSAVIMRKEDGTSKGFGFVNFEKHEDAVKSLALNEKPLGKEQKQIWCGRAQKKTERQAELLNRLKHIKMERIKQFSGINLYIKNLEDDIKEDQLRKEFSVFGTIRSLKIMTDEKNNSKGFGFICFDAPDEASRAISEMNNRPLTGTNKPLYVAYHEPKEIRRQKLLQEQLHRKQNPRPNMIQAVYPPPGYSYPSNAGPPQYMYPPQLVRQQHSRGWTYPPGPMPYQQPPAQNQLPRSNVGRSAGAAVRPKTNQPPRTRPNVEIQSIEQLYQYPPEQQKLLLGEKLYSLIQKKQPERAGKITGMLLDAGWEIEELFSLLVNEEKLNQKIDEAMGVLLTNPLSQ